MKKTLLLLCLSACLSFVGCKKDNPYQGEWKFTFFGCYFFDTNIDSKGDFEFNTTVPILVPAGFYEYLVNGNIDEDGEISGNVFYGSQNVGNFHGTALSDSLLLGSYDVEFIGPPTCSASMNGDPFFWEASIK
jgi:hypothetical protein